MSRLELVDATGNILAFIRSHGTERLLCVFNMAETEAEFTLPSGLSSSDAGCPGVTAAVTNGKLTLEPFAAYIGTLTA